MTDKNRRTKIKLRKDTASSAVMEMLGTLLRVVTVFLIVTVFCVRVARVDGHSMERTLSDNDLMIVTDLYYTPHDGDIVVISRGEMLDKPLVKRVIATAGQEIFIDFDNNAVYVDGEKLDEPYAYGETIRGNLPDEEVNGVIPEGKVFVMGDNREHSTDSRSREVGLINESDIIGKVRLDVLPHAFGDEGAGLDISRFGSVYAE